MGAACSPQYGPREDKAESRLLLLLPQSLLGPLPVGHSSQASLLLPPPLSALRSPSSPIHEEDEEKLSEDSELQPPLSGTELILRESNSPEVSLACPSVATPLPLGTPPHPVPAPDSLQRGTSPWETPAHCSATGLRKGAGAEQLWHPPIPGGPHLPSADPPPACRGQRGLWHGLLFGLERGADNVLQLEGQFWGPVLGVGAAGRLLLLGASLFCDQPPSSLCKSLAVEEAEEAASLQPGEHWAQPLTLYPWVGAAQGLLMGQDHLLQ